MLIRKYSPQSGSEPRGGVATVEFAVILPFLLLLLFGIWEMGRFIDAQMLLEGAAREGARQAAAGSRRDPNTTELTYIYATPTTGQTDVQTCVKRWLASSGINTANVTVTYQNLTNTTKAHPYQADRLDQLRVTVSIPYKDVRWSPTQFFLKIDRVLSTSVLAYSNKDDPFTVDANIPNN